MKRQPFLFLFLFGFLGVAVAGAQEPVQEAIPNWPAPAFWSPPAGRAAEGKLSGGARSLQTQTSLGSALPFIAVSPCRQYDSRNFTPLPDNTSRTVTPIGAPCGIPPTAQAVSINITVFNISGASGNGVFRVGIVSPPPTAWINFPATETQRANAGIVPTNGSGQIIIQVNMGAGQVDFTCDVNGYFAGAGTGTGNTFLGLNAGNLTMTGDANTGIGNGALFFNTSGIGNTATGLGSLLQNASGNYNTANGEGALLGNVTGLNNTAIGASALTTNASGHDNTANGFQALLKNVVGSFNTASGANALEDNTGDENTALGSGALQNNSSGSKNTASGEAALFSNTSGSENTANGYLALFFNTTGTDNTAIGTNALQQNTTGSENIGIGLDGGFNLTTGNRNICIGNSGMIGESDTIRIGRSFFQSATYIAGISGRDSPGGVAVLVNSDGKLGVATSSRRFKEEIRGIGQESNDLMKLRPVAFRYKTEIDPTGLIQYGLIAEEVAAIYPDLVVSDSEGRPETVRYHFLAPMLLNEFQKQSRQMEGQRETIELQRRRLEAQNEKINDLSARLERLEARPR